ncbi:MAG: TraR/DksA C4-type zinc finger protein [Thermodesulfobacteriota bacterium]
MPQKNVSRLKKLKEEFLAKKRKLWAEVRSEYFKKLGKDYNEQFDSPLDVEDLAVADLIEDVGLKIEDVRVKELMMIDEAIDRCDDGSYWVCKECGKTIDKKRLSVMPYAALCAACQSVKF